MTKIARVAQEIPSDPGQDQCNGWSFQKIQRHEVKEIRRPREKVVVEEEPGPTCIGSKETNDIRDQLVGLAFSGGGILSAAFNLGVLQGLAKLGLLPWFDYLSTVSGGGYMGSWLAASIPNGSGQVNPSMIMHRYSNNRLFKRLNTNFRPRNHSRKKTDVYCRVFR